MSDHTAKIKLELKLVGWWPAAVSLLLLGAFYATRRLIPSTGAPEELAFLRRAVETVVPLAFAVQASLLLAADGEPALELLAACPRPLPHLFLERLALVAGLHVGIALGATLLFYLTWHMEGLGLSLLRWLAAAACLGGVAVCATQATRQGVFGAALATFLWAASLYGGDALLKRWKWFWPFHVYLQPEKFGLGTYLLNRLILVALGVGLFLLAMKFLGAEDLLSGTR